MTFRRSSFSRKSVTGQSGAYGQECRQTSVWLLRNSRVMGRIGKSIRQGQTTPVPIRRMTNTSKRRSREQQADTKTGQSVGKLIVLIEMEAFSSRCRRTGQGLPHPALKRFVPFWQARQGLAAGLLVFQERSRTRIARSCLRQPDPALPDQDRIGANWQLHPCTGPPHTA